jgi:hypothetical protein
MKRKSTLALLRSCRYLRAPLFAVLAVAFLPSCLTMPEKKHVYDYGNDGNVDPKPFTRPESYEGNPFGGSMPQSH